MTYSFQDRHQGLLVLAKHAHDVLTRCPVTAFNVADFHSKSQHTCQTEWHALRVFVTVHGNFEAVAKVDVNDLACDSVEHQVGWMSVA
jgi:hypothetical protein